MPAGLLTALGNEEGCQRFAAAFYARVQGDPVLRPLFPGKTLRCATDEFAAFLVQFLGGSEQHTQHRWWLSLRESHARFSITPAQRAAWLRHMGATLDAAPLDEPTRETLRQFFRHGATYVSGQPTAEPHYQGELAACWSRQRLLDEAISALAAQDDDKVLLLAQQIAPRPSVFVGLLARLLQTGRATLLNFVVQAIRQQPALAQHRFGGKALVHFASGAGSVEVVELLLQLGVDPNEQDRGGHDPLYCVANQCASPEAGPQLVRMLVSAGADVNFSGGVTGATALHMAARRGFVEIAQALLDCGAAPFARDRKGDTPLQRARNCRRHKVVQVLETLKR